jgi:hypothetical protein
VIAVAFNPDGKTLASGNQDGTIELWDVATGKEQATLERHLGFVCSVAFSPDGKTLASGSDDSTIKLWDVTTGKPEMVSVPDVIGLSFEQAESKFQGKLQYQRYAPVITGKVKIGAIADQSPAKDQRVPIGTKVTLRAEAPSIEVPNLVGKTVGDALGDIRSLKLNDEVKVGPNRGVDMWAPVVQQSPEPGTRVAAGAKVTITQQ